MLYGSHTALSVSESFLPVVFEGKPEEQWEDLGLARMAGLAVQAKLADLAGLAVRAVRAK